MVAAGSPAGEGGRGGGGGDETSHMIDWDVRGHLKDPERWDGRHWTACRCVCVYECVCVCLGWDLGGCAVVCGVEFGQILLLIMSPTRPSL